MKAERWLWPFGAALLATGVAMWFNSQRDEELVMAETPFVPFVRVAVPEIPWALVSPRQIEVAERFGAPVAIEAAEGRRFVLVPAGAYIAGARPREPGSAEDETAHEVRLSLPCYVQLEATPIEGPFDPAALEAEAARLSAADPVWDFRWIREGEWEFAARAGTEGVWPTSAGDPPPAGEPFVNAWGLAGVVGGLEEVVSDAYGPYPSWGVADPVGPPLADGTPRVGRGGVDEHGRPVRVADRRPVPPGTIGRRGWRLVAPMGYGLGAYGKHAVTFAWRERDPTLHVDPDAVELSVSVNRMENRLGSRTLGQVPPWERIAAAATGVATRLVPGRYYAFVEAGREGEPGHLRGVEIKFVVEGESVVELPLPRFDARQFTDSSPQ